MLVEEKIIEVVGLKKSHRRTLVLQCDQCNAVYTSTRNLRRSITQKHHYCSDDCRKEALSNGKTRELLDSVFQEKFGGKSPFSSCDVQSKCVESLFVKVGVKHNFHRSDVKEMAKIARSSDISKQKIRNTCEEKYGKKCVFQLKGVREKAVRSTTSEAARRKRKETCLSRYGVEVASSSDEVKLKISIANSRPGVCSQRHETMKKNGSYGKSKTEDEFYSVLCNAFGSDNVDRQVTLPETRWPIDFYVKTIDSYVQLDGVYWHGIGRDVDEVAEHKTKRDVTIHRKMLTDLTQCEWFKANGKILIRITDKEFKAMGISSLKNHVFSGNIDWEVVEERVKKAESIAQEVK